MNSHYKMTWTQIPVTNDWRHIMSFGIKSTHTKSEEKRIRQRSYNVFTIDKKSTSIESFGKKFVLKNVPRRFQLAQRRKMFFFGRKNYTKVINDFVKSGIAKKVKWANSMKLTKKVSKWKHRHHGCQSFTWNN